MPHEDWGSLCGKLPDIILWCRQGFFSKYQALHSIKCRNCNLPVSTVFLVAMEISIQLYVQRCCMRVHTERLRVCPPTIVLQGSHQRRKKSLLFVVNGLAFWETSSPEASGCRCGWKSHGILLGGQKRQVVNLKRTFAAPKVVKMRLQQIGRVKNLKWLK